MVMLFELFQVALKVRLQKPLRKKHVVNAEVSMACFATTVQVNGVQMLLCGYLCLGASQMT